MNQFLSEILEKYTKIVKSANLIWFLNQLAKTSNLTDKSTPWQHPQEDTTSWYGRCSRQYAFYWNTFLLEIDLFKLSYTKLLQVSRFIAQLRPSDRPRVNNLKFRLDQFLINRLYC